MTKSIFCHIVRLRGEGRFWKGLRDNSPAIHPKGLHGTRGLSVTDSKRFTISLLIAPPIGIAPSLHVRNRVGHGKIGCHFSLTVRRSSSHCFPEHVYPQRHAELITHPARVISSPILPRFVVAYLQAENPLARVSGARVYGETRNSCGAHPTNLKNNNNLVSSISGKDINWVRGEGDSSNSWLLAQNRCLRLTL